MSGGAITTFRAFWPYYLREHASPATRRIHYLGTGLALACLIAGIVSGERWIAAGALLAGYAPAWFAHFFVEHNRPATFRYPLWSLFCDFRMAGLWAIGRLEPELKAAGVMTGPARPGVPTRS